MTEDIIIREWRIPSATGVGALQLKSWSPAVQPKLVFQIVHGMAEHMARYDAFARYLAGQGVYVIACDLPGHGKSAPDEKHLGYAAERDGWIKVVDDLNSVTDQARLVHPDLPLVLFGHSMGSYLAREYCVRYGKRLSGVILSGTMAPNRPLFLFGRLIASTTGRLRGPLHRVTLISTLMNRMFLQRITDRKSVNDWLSRDPAVVRAYDADPLCGFTLTAAGFRDLFDLLSAISSPEWAKKFPAGLPVRLIAGEADPVSGYGEGTHYVYRVLKEQRHQDVEMRLYPDARHELLNETIRERVYQDITAMIQPWMLQGGQT